MARARAFDPENDNFYDVTAAPAETTLYYSDAAGNDWILGDSSTDSYGITNLSYESETGEPLHAYSWVWNGNNRTIIVNGAIENAAGGPGSDYITGNSLDNLLFGDPDQSDHGADGIGGTDSISGLGGDDTIYGGAAVDTIYGNAGNDTLEGGLGKDTLTGGGGKDSFIFATALKGSADTIDDFSVRNDTFKLDNVIFSALKTGVLPDKAFAANQSGHAQDGSDRIIYETDTGELYYDKDGKGGTKAVEFAVVDKDLKLTHEDFVILHGWTIDPFG